MPSPTVSPSRRTTGITSRTLDEVKTSAAPTSRSRGYSPSARRMPASEAAATSVSRVTPARMPSSSAGRVQHVVLDEPDVRRRALERDPLEREEERVVRPAPASLRLRRHVDGVARRLHPREEPRRLAAGRRTDRELKRRELDPAGPHLVEPVRKRRHQHEADRPVAARARRPHDAQHGVGPVERAQRLGDEPLERREIRRRELEHARRLAEAAQVQVDAKRHARRRRASSRRPPARAEPPRRRREAAAAPGRRRRGRARQGQAASRARVRWYCG